EEYLENPEAVPSEWRALFESGSSELVATHPGLARLLDTLAADGNGHVAAPPPPVPAPAAAPPDETLLGAVAAGMALVKAHRTHGHLAARLDPLGSEPPGDPALEPERLVPKLTPELQAQVPARVLRTYVGGETMADALPRLQETYCGTSAYELEHISDHEERVWLRQAIESGRYRTPLSADEKRRLLGRLTEVEGFERFLRRAFLGQKQFSIEGLDVMVPMLDETVELAADGGAHEVVIGMAHRGRLSVLAHTIGQPYEAILREFEGERTIEAVVSDPEGGSGDVKYHLGAEGVRKTTSGEITVTLCSNPSDLAKGFDIPIIHVNADDPEAAISAIRLALAFRRRFGHDVVVDLVGYRRFGHNEQDEPAYTQPLMAQRIAVQPTVREQFAARLVSEGVITEADAERMVAEVRDELRSAHEQLKQSFAGGALGPDEPEIGHRSSDGVVTAIGVDRLRELDAQLLQVPDGFVVHP